MCVAADRNPASVDGRNELDACRRGIGVEAGGVKRQPWVRRPSGSPIAVVSQGVVGSVH